MTRPKPKKPAKVAGEQVDLLVEALRQIDFETEPDGMIHCRIDLPPRLGDPLMRATMRVEAELLLADARVYCADDHEARSPDGRRLDAFVLLTRRVVAAVTNGPSRGRARPA